MSDARIGVHPGSRRNAGGFTLLEVMIAVAIVAILAGIALPSYFQYLARSRIVAATSSLSDFRVKMEQFFQDNRSYANAGGGCGVDDPPATPYFELACSGASVNGYQVNANGKGNMSAFRYQLTVNAGVVGRSTLAVDSSSGWNLPSPNNCWTIRPDGSCS
jgi:type IV pilus assembly protein PilE